MALPLLSSDVFDFPAVNKQPSKSALVAFQVLDKLIFSILAPSPVGQNRIWEYVEVLKYQNKKKYFLVIFTRSRTTLNMWYTFCGGLFIVQCPEKWCYILHSIHLQTIPWNTFSFIISRQKWRSNSW